MENIKKHIIIFLLYAMFSVTGFMLFMKYYNPPKFYYVFPESMKTINHNSDDFTKNMYTELLEEANIQPTPFYQHASIIMFHKLFQIHQYQDIKISSKCKVVFGLETIDMFASKASLYHIFGKKNYHYIPKTWDLSSKDDMNDLKIHFDDYDKPLFPMILKKNIQRQTGITFVKDISDLDSSNASVCQEVLNDPLLIYGRKINIRVYLLIVCTNNVNMYMYDDGFIYYAKKKWDDTISFDTHITSGYVERSIYDTHPLTLKNLYEHIGTKNADSLKENILKLMNNLQTSYHNILKFKDTNTKGITRCNILGVDIAPNDKYDVTIMEINKGPDLNAKDERDGFLKRNLIKNAFELCNVLPKNEVKNNFIKLISL
jgi:hypothetical protein